MAMVTKENPSAESKKRFQSAAAGVGAEAEAEEGKLTHIKTWLQSERTPYHTGR